MTPTVGTILIVEDDPILLDQLSWALREKFQVLRAHDASEGRSLLESEPDVYLFDMRLPPSGEVEEGLGLLTEVRRRQPDATVVMMSGEGERKHALKAMELGAFDFFQKPLDPAEVRVILGRALERRRLLAENRLLREQTHGDGSFGKLIGKSAPMRRLFREIEKVAPSDVTVLVQGESGTGKELVAHSIHAASL
ncbi:MAG TPA: response regulator, partial [Thermoanaerobaculia bacterium]|nr:response regulator [Thermoanaerobaculia bacterium]